MPGDGRAEKQHGPDYAVRQDFERRGKADGLEIDGREAPDEEGTQPAGNAEHGRVVSRVIRGVRQASPVAEESGCGASDNARARAGTVYHKAA